MSGAAQFHPFSPTTPDGTARAVIARAQAVLDPLLDDVRRVLAPAAGRTEVTMKADGTPVTPHDRATDERIVTTLLDAFPGHGAVSEEQSHVASDAEWTWVLDPIDGTSNFIAGLPYWCVAIALCLQGSPVLGVVEAPALGLRFQAVAGGGATQRDATGEQALRVTAPVPLHDPSSAHVPALLSGGAARDLAADGARMNARLLGASALDLAMVARGSAPLSVALGPHVWDIAAGALLVTEAGGAVLGAGERPLLPLTAGRDYADAVIPTAAACDEPSAATALEAVARGRARR